MCAKLDPQGAKMEALGTKLEALRAKLKALGAKLVKYRTTSSRKSRYYLQLLVSRFVK